MIRLRHLPQSAFRRSRWKNGGGETIEIAISPEKADLDTFDWRISMARVAASGPFSIFSGVDRTLCVLEGEGIELDFQGQPRVRLDGQSPPYRFSGDVAVSSHVSGAGITDLNVMTRRGVARHHVSRTDLDRGDHLLAASGATLVILAADMPVMLRLGDEVAELRRGDVAVLSPGKDPLWSLTCEAPGRVFMIDLW